MYYIEQKINNQWIPLTDAEDYILRFHNRSSAQFHVDTQRIDNARIVYHYLAQGTKASDLIKKESN